MTDSVFSRRGPIKNKFRLLFVTFLSVDFLLSNAFDEADVVIGLMVVVVTAVVVLVDDDVVGFVETLVVAVMLVVAAQLLAGEFSKYARLTKSVRIGSPLLHLLYFE